MSHGDWLTHSHCVTFPALLPPGYNRGYLFDIASMGDQPQRLKRQAVYLEYLTITWCLIEAAVSIWSGISARSIALLAFGLDSGIEVFAGFVVVWQLRGVGEERNAKALRLIAITFFILAAYVLVDSVRQLVAQIEPGESIVGIVVTTAALVVMPLLAWAKWRVGKKSSNTVLVSEATETMLCALLSGAALAGLLLNTAFGWWWADPVAGIVIGLYAFKEGRETWQGHGCGDCSEDAHGL
jgi:divalent metal cation (Fe/Co/Zn/Cd) transporter